MPQYIVMSDPVQEGRAQPPLAPGRDYPRTYREFAEMFPTNEECAAYLERLRWPDGFICPVCQTSVPPSRHTRGQLVCRACRYQASVTAGTILGKTRTPLTTWFEAAWHVTTAKNGLSAKSLDYAAEVPRGHGEGGT
jgi:hypothetical protein